jgi:hypothetical protein
MEVKGIDACNEQSSSLGAPPHFHSALECSELAVRNAPGILMLQALEQLLGRSVRLSLEPVSHTRPQLLEGVLTRAPVSRTLR